MIKIAIVVPYGEMAGLAQSVFQEHTNYMKEHFQSDTEYSLDIIVAATTDAVLTKQPDCDVMIVRGGAYQDLRQMSLPFPLVELITSGIDMVNNLLQLSKQYGNLPAAILGTANMVLGIEPLAAQMGVDVTPYIFDVNTREEIRRKVNQAHADGKKVIIGGKTGCLFAEQLGLHALLLESGRDTFWKAITEAKQIAQVRLSEREKALAFQNLLDNAYEGLVALDRNNCISFINASAIRILQLPSREHHTGKHFLDVIFSAPLSRILSAPNEYVNEIIPYKNTHLSVKKMNLFMSGVQVGSVLTFLNASQIQSTEDKLRGKLYHKGHHAKYSFDNLITQSPRMADCVREAKLFAQTDSNIMIVGESGTGKELVSQSIHTWSHRKNNNFVALNCAALPENLLESELFGYVEGAFTGAAKGGKPGMFEIAHNGTLFLDEISEIPLRLQGRLLRVLQEREIMRLGDDKIIPINIRVIAATNKNLEELVESGQFRRDLYYRLYVLQLNLPPLRNRKEDIPLLVQDFLEYFCRSRSCTTIPELSAEDYQLLQMQPWYGNIRELRNFCERLAVLYQPDASVSSLLVHLLEDRRPILNTQSSITTFASTPTPSPDERYRQALSAIRACRGNKTLAAEKLGISRATLWRLLKQNENSTPV